MIVLIYTENKRVNESLKQSTKDMKMNDPRLSKEYYKELNICTTHMNLFTEISNRQIFYFELVSKIITVIFIL